MWHLFSIREGHFQVYIGNNNYIAKVCSSISNGSKLLPGCVMFTVNITVLFQDFCFNPTSFPFSAIDTNSSNYLCCFVHLPFSIPSQGLFSLLFYIPMAAIMGSVSVSYIYTSWQPHSFIHSFKFNKYSFRIYYVPDTEDTTVFMIQFPSLRNSLQLLINYVN